MLVCVPADQCESGNCRWLNLEPYINLARKTKDGRLYEVVIQTWSLKWLFFLECDTNLNCNPTAPTKEDILILGFKKATVIAHAGFLSNAVNEIRSRRCQGYKECCRHYARSNGLAITFERILLIHDIVVSSFLFALRPSNFANILRNLIHQFANVLRNAFCFLV